MLSKRALGFLAVALLPLATASAPAAADEWHSDLALYMWGSGLSGTVGAGPVAASVDMSFSEILDNLEIGAMAGYVGSNGRWVFLADGVRANLGVSDRGSGGLYRADVDVDMTIVEGDIGYAVTKNIALFGGARWVDLTNEVEVRLANQSYQAKGGESWVDPVVGVRFASPLGRRWSYVFRLDAGGFGVGSDRSWNGVAAFSFALTKSIRMGAGYRWLDIDYEQGSGRDHFIYNTRMEGPVAGLVFSF